jgi:hypothetical protein
VSEYGKRDYAAKWGRWISRDPVGEFGGLCIYSSFVNDPISETDALGELAGGFLGYSDAEFSSSSIYARTPANEYSWCECKCRGWFRYGYLLTCSLQVTYIMSFANQSSSVWNSSPAPLPSEPTPPDWHIWGFAHKKAYILAHENRHVSHYRKWYDDMVAKFDLVERRSYPTKENCERQSIEIINEADSTWNTMYNNEIAHSPAAGW